MQPEQFETHARVEDHHWWFTARRAILLEVVSAIAPAGTPVADVGCGTGGNAAAFGAAGHPVIGLDPSADAIALAQSRFPSLRFDVSSNAGDASAHLRNGGVLLLTDVLEHVENDRALFESAVSAVPSGGHLIITVPADASLWSPHDVAFGHFRRYSPEMLEVLISSQPVVARLLTPFNSRLYPLVAIRRRWVRGGATKGGDLDVPAGPFNRILHRIFAGEHRKLVAGIDRGRAVYSRGVSLIAVLRRP